MICLLPVVGFWLYKHFSYVPPIGQTYVAQITPTTTIELVGVSRGLGTVPLGEWWQPDGHLRSGRIPLGVEGYGVTASHPSVRSAHFQVQHSDSNPEEFSMQFRFRMTPKLQTIGFAQCGNSLEENRHSIHFIPDDGHWERIGVELDISTRGAEPVAEFGDDELPSEFFVNGVGVEFRQTRDEHSRKRVVEMKKTGHTSPNLLFSVSFFDMPTAAQLRVPMYSNPERQVFEIGDRTNYTMKFSKHVYDRRVTFSNIAKNPEEFTRVEISDVELLPLR